jgi:hypothetical protein
MVILGALGGVEWLSLGTTWASWLLGVGLARDSLFVWLSIIFGRDRALPIRVVSGECYLSWLKLHGFEAWEWKISPLPRWTQENSACFDECLSYHVQSSLEMSSASSYWQMILHVFVLHHFYPALTSAIEFVWDAAQLTETVLMTTCAGPM